MACSVPSCEKQHGTRPCSPTCLVKGNVCLRGGGGEGEAGQTLWAGRGVISFLLAPWSLVCFASRAGAGAYHHRHRSPLSRLSLPLNEQTTQPHANTTTHTLHRRAYVHHRASTRPASYCVLGLSPFSPPLLLIIIMARLHSLAMGLFLPFLYTPPTYTQPHTLPHIRQHTQHGGTR